MNKFYVFMSLCLYVFMSHSQAYTYTCTSDFTHQINLDSNSNIYPSKGAIYDIAFDNKKQYQGFCDVPSSGLTAKEMTYYKAAYGNDYTFDSDGYAVLNDFVKVKSYIYIYNQGNTLVPFSDISNKAPEIPKTSTYFASGSSGKVEVLIQKSILQGTITIPEFNIYLYSRYARSSDGYNTKPLSIVHFKESTLNVEKVCNIANLPFNESILNQSLGGLLNNSNSLKDVSFTISCTKNVSDLNLKLSFSGEPYKYDSRFFRSDVDSIGIGLYNGSYIYGNNGFPLSLSNGQATVSMQIVPVVQDKKTEINSTVNFNIQPVIYQ